MRWPTKIRSNHRSRWKFCLFPYSFSGTTYWLEWIYVYEKFTVNYCDSYWEVYAVVTPESFKKVRNVTLPKPK